MTSLNRRSFLAGTSALGLAAIAGPAFAQQGFDFGAPMTDMPAPDGPLRWLDSGDQKGVFFREFLANYGEARGIETVYDGLPWVEIATVVPLGVRNESAPDAFALPLDMPPAVAIDQGWVQPLDDYIPDIAEWRAGFPTGSFIEGVNMRDGKTYGLPFTSDRRSSTLLLFGREAMALTDYDPSPENPLNWDEFRTAARQITENSGGSVYGFILGGAQVNRWRDAVLSLASRAGAHYGVSGFVTGFDFSTGEYALNSEEVVAAVELLLAMRDDGSTFPGLLSLNAPQARAFTAQGNAGMILQGPWNVPLWEANNPEFDFGFTWTPAPEGADGKTYVNTLPSAANMMFLNADAKNPYHAAEVFRLMGTVEGQTAWANVVGPSDPAIFPAANEQAEMSERARAVIALQEQQVRATPVPYSASTGFVEVARAFQMPTPDIAQTVQGLFAGQLTDVQGELDRLNAAMTDALEAAIAEANAAGADVSREQLVFEDWDPTTDYAG
ncbi:sugar ABC transporter, periplasmic sugar-binding protein [Oceanicola granulosus HTCC2516]|uniref:sn-glycerol-3-phosphate-binding periplasmic protein UgpB n=1 Tax=Oceanicola granulosus (strain ATCC BAA-861 / DSM 15982 / KCTC 12143 / HTCC2516) TaxID=314256 RepID=Q2CEI8_OCEGH|nr:extracellular solute-binding protein [Oceanicola granulosus]EAR51144.1 sugar ABC transporter, periplasmic sugar-binding protein [Oceanicola granulosus HTCC2516]